MKRRGAAASPACAKGTALTKKMPASVSAAGASARKSRKSTAAGANRPTYSAVQMDALRPARGRGAGVAACARLPAAGLRD